MGESIPSAAAARLTVHDLDDDLLRRAFGRFPTGITVLSATVDGQVIGMTASSFTSVSLMPPLVSACLSTSSTTWPVLRTAERIGISVLSAGQQQLCRQLAMRGVDRFAGVGRTVARSGAVKLRDACAWFDCSVVDEIAAGDHAIVVFRLHDLTVDHTLDPLVFHGSTFRSLRSLTERS